MIPAVFVAKTPRTGDPGLGESLDPLARDADT
jgi:hypothetical protein